jgi:hypothetical protein
VWRERSLCPTVPTALLPVAVCGFAVVSPWVVCTCVFEEELEDWQGVVQSRGRLCAQFMAAWAVTALPTTAASRSYSARRIRTRTAQKNPCAETREATTHHTSIGEQQVVH